MDTTAGGMSMGSFAYGPRVRSHRKAIAIGLVIGLLTAASVAVAVWLITADVTSNPGKAKAGALIAPIFTTTLDAHVTEPGLFPGNTGGLTFRIINGNTQALTLTALVALVGGATIESDKAGCGAADLQFNPQTTLTVPVPVGEGTIVVPGAVTLRTTAATECQDAMFRVSSLRATFST